MSAVLPSQHWSSADLACLDAMIRVRELTHLDLDAFPGRSREAVRKKAQKRRVQLRLPQFRYSRPADEDVDDEPELIGPDDPIHWAASSAALHHATVRMCMRRGITLPGMSPARTIAIARNLGISI